MVWHDMACLIVICDFVLVRTTEWVGMLVNDDDVNLLVLFVVTSVFIVFPTDNNKHNSYFKHIRTIG